MALDLLADQFSYQGIVVGKTGDPGVEVCIMGDEGITGLSSPPRNLQLADRQGHGRVPGSQWATERTVVANVWTRSLDALLAFDAAMAPRPSPLDDVPWTGNFVGLGERRIWVFPNEPDWKIDQLGNAGNLWRAKLSWTAPDPTIFAEDETVTTFGPGATNDETIVNTGTSESMSGRAWIATITASGGPAVDPYIESTDDDTQSIRFVGFTLAAGETITIHHDRTCTIGSEHLEGRIRSRGGRIPNWPTLPPGTSNWRVGTAVSGSVTAEVRSRSTWSV